MKKKDNGNNLQKNKFNIFVLVVIIATAFAMLLTAFVKESLDKKFYKKNLISIDQLAKKIEHIALDNEIMGCIKILGLVDSDIKDVTTGKKTPNNNKIFNIVNEIKQMFGAKDVFILNSKGYVVANSSSEYGQNIIGNNYKFSYYFNNAMKGHDTLFVAIDKVSRARSLFYTVPVIDYHSAQTQANKVDAIGVITVEMNFSQIDTLLYGISSPILILSPDGVVFATNRDDWLFKVKKNITAKELKNALEKKQYGDIFNKKTLKKLPFSINVGKTVINGIEYAITKTSLKWKDIAGSWYLIRFDDDKWLTPLWLIVLLFILVYSTFIPFGFLIISKYESSIFLKKREERLRLALEATGHGIWDYNIEDETIFLNIETFNYIKSLIPKDIHSMKKIIHSDDVIEFEQKLNQYIKGKSNIFSMEFRLKCGQGHWKWVLSRGKIVSYNQYNKPIRFIGSIVDIDERKQIEKKLEHMVITDPMTGFFNRHHFLYLAKREFALAKRYSRSLAILYIDIDNFKMINDSHGHSVGDRAIIDLCKSFTKNFRKTDIVGRLGGDEFGVMLIEINRKNVEKIATQLQQLAQKVCIRTNNKVISFTISIGVCILDSENKHSTLEKILEFADQALYNAKETGRDKIVFYKDIKKK